MYVVYIKFLACGALERGLGLTLAAETPRPGGVVSSPREDIGRGGGVQIFLGGGYKMTRGACDGSCTQHAPSCTLSPLSVSSFLLLYVFVCGKSSTT